MAYEKQTWETGQVITAEKLNHMEDGIAAGGVLIVHANFDETTEMITLDKTWQQIKDALFDCSVVIQGGELTKDIPVQLFVENNQYVINTVLTMAQQCQFGYTTNSPNGYPSMKD